MKKIVSILMICCMVICVFSVFDVDAASQVDKIIAAGKSILGSQKYNGYCQAFVRWCYEEAGIYTSSNAGSALQAWQWWGVSTSRDNIPVGACVYFDSEFSPTLGHVGIYLGNNQFIHAVSKASDGINGVKISSFSSYWNRYYKGWGWQAGKQPSGTDYVTEPPSNVWIKSTHGTATSYDNVTLSWGADNATTYWMHIYKDGQDFINQSVGNSTSYARTYSEGNYTVYIEAANSVGKSPVVHVCFSVADKPPQNIWLKTDKATYQINETVSFSFNSNGTNDIRDLYIYFPNGSQEVYCNQGTSFSKAFTMPGKYEALVQAWNSVGPECSKKIVFHIGKPTGTWVKTDKTTYKINEIVNFSFDSSISSDVRDLYIYLPDGSQEVYNNQGTSFSKAFTMPGKYEALAQSWNSIGTELTSRIIFYVHGTEDSVDATVQKNGNNYSVEVIPHNMGEDIEIIMAGCRGSQLISFEKKKYGAEELAFSITGNIDKVKIMAWESIGGMKSICKAKVIPASEFLVE